MYIVTACIRVANGHSFNDVYNDLKWLERETQSEDGCLHFSLYASNRERGEFILWEKWKSKEALDIHFQQVHTKKLVGKGITEIVWIYETTI